MPDSPFKMPSVPHFDTTTIPVDSHVVEQPQANPTQRPSPKASKPTPQPKMQRAIPPKFEVAHAKFFNGKMFAFCFGLVIAQGVLAKIQAETGLPTWEIYWLAVATIAIVGLVGSSRMGSSTGFVLLLQFTVSAAVAPAFAILFRLVFGG
jgi:hypothetical protein